MSVERGNSQRGLGCEEKVKAAFLYPRLFANPVNGCASVRTGPNQVKDGLHQSLLGVADAFHTFLTMATKTFESRDIESSEVADDVRQSVRHCGLNRGRAGKIPLALSLEKTLGQNARRALVNGYLVGAGSKDFAHQRPEYADSILEFFRDV